MTFPSKNNIFIGFFFVFFGLIMALCDRYQLKLIVPGSSTRKPHTFSHVFFLWFLRQLMQLGLLFLWKAIFEKNLWGIFGRFKHGEIREEDDPQPAAVVDAITIPDEINDYGNIQGNDVNDDVRENLIGDDTDEQNNENGVRQRRPRLHFPPTPQTNHPRQRKQKKYIKLLFFPPALFDVVSVLLVYFGTQLTYPSSFGLFKGTVAFFTILLAVAFMAQQFPIYIWFGVVLATLGMGSLGISDFIHKPPGYEKYGIAAGSLQIVMGQIMFATKLIYEEKFIRKHSIHPMKFLGLEACYGFFFATLLLLVFNFVDGVQYSEMPNGNIEDVSDFCQQFISGWQPAVVCVGSLLSFMIYTYLGLFLVRDQGALPRIMIELLVWTFYWAICIALDWEDFYYEAQVPGFIAILIGLMLYAHILVIPLLNYTCHKKDEMIGDEVDDSDDEMVNLVAPGDGGELADVVRGDGDVPLLGADQ